MRDFWCIPCKFLPSLYLEALVECFSQMDLGVGSFVFSQGLVSALPLIKNQPSMDTQSDSDLRTNIKQKPDLSLTAAFLPKLRAVLLKVLPLIVMGLIRVVLVKGSGYPVGCEIRSFHV